MAGASTLHNILNKNGRNDTSNEHTNVLNNYNHLFKRQEVVTLKHNWDSDKDDNVADVPSSDDDKEANILTTMGNEEDRSHAV